MRGGLQDPTDAELWEAATRSDPAAFGLLFDRHARAVYNFCFRRTGDWSLAEDLVSAVFLEAWRRRREITIDAPSALPWLLGIANNLLLNAQRSLKRYRAALRRVPPPPEEDDFSDDVVNRMQDADRVRDVLATLRRLSSADVEILTLSVWGGLTYEELSVALRIPVGTVRSRLSRARERLRELSGEAGHVQVETVIDQTKGGE